MNNQKQRNNYKVNKGNLTISSSSSPKVIEIKSKPLNVNKFKEEINTNSPKLGNESLKDTIPKKDNFPVSRENNSLPSDVNNNRAIPKPALKEPEDSLKPREDTPINNGENNAKPIVNPVKREEVKPKNNSENKPAVKKELPPLKKAGNKNLDAKGKPLKPLRRELTKPEDKKDLSLPKLKIPSKERIIKDAGQKVLKKFKRVKEEKEEKKKKDKKTKVITGAFKKIIVFLITHPVVVIIMVVIILILAAFYAFTASIGGTDLVVMDTLEGKEKHENYKEIFEAVDKVSEEYEAKGIEIDKYLILATLVSEKDLVYIQDKPEKEITTSKMELKKFDEKARLLAEYQIRRKTLCKYPSNTVREIASNDKSASKNLLSDEIKNERNFDCTGSSKDNIELIVDTEEGNLDDDNSGSVFYWNIIDGYFFDYYYNEYLDNVDIDDLKTVKASLLKSIYRSRDDFASTAEKDK